jgi:hypothetical protein
MTSVGARLGLNEIPQISWKGKTFTQISSSLQLNTIPPARSIRNTMIARPVKHNRREIASRPTLKTGNPRVSLRIDELTGPNGYLVSQTTSCTGDQSTLDFNLTADSTQKPGVCQTQATCVANNALKRVRSAGMVNKNYNINRNNDHYCTSSKEYLVSRNKTYSQNQYAYIRQGNAQAVPGTGLSSNNIYAAGGLSHCALATISAVLGNNTFQYIWVDSNTYTVTIPDGTTYDVGTLNGILASTMIQNTHYIIDNLTYSYIIPLSITYDTFTGKIQLQSMAIDTTIFDTTGTGYYSLPQGATWDNPTFTICPQFVIPDTPFQNVIGFSAGIYPDAPIFIYDNSGNSYVLGNQTKGVCQPFYNGNGQPYYTAVNPPNIPPHIIPIAPYRYLYPATEYHCPFGLGDISFGSDNIPSNTTAYTTNQIFESSFQGSILPNYVTANYKPNNPTFGVQGAVDGGAYIDRVRFNAITTSASTMSTVWGNETADALAYGVNPSGEKITAKLKYGMPITTTPKFNPRTGQMSNCQVRYIKGG